MGLFDGAFNPNLGWLGQAMSPVVDQPDDPMNPTNNWGAPSRGHDSLAQLLAQLLPPTQGGQQTSPWAQPQAPQQSIDPNAGIPISAQAPPMGAPQNVGPGVIGNGGLMGSYGGQPAGPSLDQRAYGSQGPAGPMVPPSVIGGAPQMPQQAQSAMAQAQPQGGDFLGGLQNFSQNLQNNPGVGGIINAMRGTQTGQNYGGSTLQKTGTDPNTGQDTFAWVNPMTQTMTPATAGGGAGNPGQNNGFLAPGTSYLNSAATGEDYMKQWSPEVQNAAKAYLAGNIVPTGNPRQNALASKAKEVAIKYGADMGIPFSDARYSEARKFRTELGSTQANTVGGQAKAFAQGTEHMVKLSDTLEKLDNSNGLGIPALADGVNAMRQWASTDQSAISDKARSIGQTLSGEIGKLFSGSAGGGVEERRLTRDRFDTVKSPKQLAAALEATLETMHGGLAALEQRRDQVLGPQGGADVKFVDDKTAANITRIEQTIARLKGEPSAAQSGGAKPGVTSNGVKWSVQ